MPSCSIKITTIIGKSYTLMPIFGYMVKGDFFLYKSRARFSLKNSF